MHYIEIHIQSLCDYCTVLMTSQSLYMKPHPLCRATYTLYMRHHSHSLCPHTQSIDNITHTLCMTSHSPYVWHRFPIQDITSSLYDLNHHVYVITPTIFDMVSTLCGCAITSTVLMISHQLYFCDDIHYNLQHHIPCIRHDSHCMITQPLHS